MGLLDFDSPDTRLGLGLLAAASARSDGAGFGQRLQEGLASADSWKARQQAAKMQEMQMQYQTALMQQHQQEMIAKQRANEIAAKKAQALPTIFSSGSSGAPALNVDSLLPPEMRTGVGYQPAIAPKSAGVDVQRALAAGFTPDEIEKLDKLRNVGLDEVARTIKGMQGGKEVEQQFDKFGRKIGAGFEQYRAPIEVSTGARKDLLDPYSLSPKASFAMEQSPDSKASNAVAWANNAINQERLKLDKEKFGFEKTNGASKSTEGEKTAGALLQRLRSSQLQMDDALSGGKTGAEKPSLVAQGMRAIGAESMANTWNSAERQRVEAAQLDILDAALTLGTGAAYTKEQLEGYRKSYFPQIGDSLATIKDKQDRLQNILSAAEIKAGAAAKSVPTVEEMKAARLKKVAPNGSLGSGSFEIISVE